MAVTMRRTVVEAEVKLIATMGKKGHSAPVSILKAVQL